MKKHITYATSLLLAGFLTACGGDASVQNTGSAPKSMVKEKKVDPMIEAGKGTGEITNVELTDPMNQEWIVSGKAIHEMKCASCHKLTDSRVVGPGFQGITNRRKPEWIMNMITNTSVMLEEDPAAQKLLEECLTRMPNQNVSNDDARKILEYLRHNDMETAGSKDGARS